MADALPAGLVLGFVGAFGSLIGSFLNVCIHRLPRGVSVVTPRSACPRCGSPIPWYLNVPVLSWLLLRGRGACCGARIPARYPFVEALAASAAVVVFVQQGPTLEGFARFLFLSALIVLFYTDLDLRLLPDAVTLPLTAAGLALSFFRPAVGPVGAAAAAALGAGGFLAVSLLWRRLRRVEAVGGGDIKMMAMIGAFLGPGGMLVTLLIASVLGAGVGCGLAAAYAARRLAPLAARRPDAGRAGLALALFGRGLRRKTVPFGCFLSVGAAASLFWGDRLAGWYLGLLG